MAITPTQLRTNLYNILDQVIETNRPVEIHRKGKILKLVVDRMPSKLSNLKSHPKTISVDPEDLVHVDWFSYWQKGNDL